jgi:hypothetical protein
MNVDGNDNDTVDEFVHWQLHKLALLKMNSLLQVQLPSTEFMPAKSVGPEKISRRDDPEDIKFAEAKLGAGKAAVFGNKAIDILVSTT